MSDKACEMCKDTGYYGDNGPGISRNNEYHECDYCEKGKALSHDAERRERAEKTACRNLPTAFLEAGVVEKMVEYFKLIKQLHEFCFNHDFDNDKHLNENCDKLDGLNGRIRDAKQEIMKLLEESK